MPPKPKPVSGEKGASMTLRSTGSVTSEKAGSDNKGIPVKKDEQISKDSMPLSQDKSKDDVTVTQGENLQLKSTEAQVSNETMMMVEGSLGEDRQPDNASVASDVESTSSKRSGIKATLQGHDAKSTKSQSSRSSRISTVSSVRRRLEAEEAKRNVLRLYGEQQAEIEAREALLREEEKRAEAQRLLQLEEYESNRRLEGARIELQRKQEEARIELQRQAEEVERLARDEEVRKQRKWEEEEQRRKFEQDKRELEAHKRELEEIRTQAVNDAMLEVYRRPLSSQSSFSREGSVYRSKHVYADVNKLESAATHKSNLQKPVNPGLSSMRSAGITGSYVQSHAKSADRVLQPLASPGRSRYEPAAQSLHHMAPPINLNRPQQVSSQPTRPLTTQAAQTKKVSLVHDYNSYSAPKVASDDKPRFDASVSFNRLNIDNCGKPVDIFSHRPIDVNLKGNTLYSEPTAGKFTDVSHNNVSAGGLPQNLNDATDSACVLNAPIDGIQSSANNPDSTLRLFNEIMLGSKLPNINLHVFDGTNPLDYVLWKTSFQSLIESATTEPIRRMTYLNQYLSGKAKMLVEGYMCDISSNGYASAMAVLDREFANPTILSRCYMNRIDNFKALNGNDSVALQEYSTFLTSTLGAMTSLHGLQLLNLDFSLQKIVLKLPNYMQTAWRNIVFDAETKGEMADFSCLVKFVEREALKARHPVFSNQALHLANASSKNVNTSNSNKSNSGEKGVKVFFTSSSQQGNASSQDQVSPRPVRKGPFCYVCEVGTHYTDKCRKLSAMPFDQRINEVKAKRLCFACLKHCSKNHSFRSCKFPRHCEICKQKHPTCMHNPAFSPEPVSPTVTVNTIQVTETPVSAVSCAIIGDNDSKILMPVVLVRVRINGKSTVTLAALDSLSNSSFMSKALWQELGSTGTPVQISVKTLKSDSKQNTMAVNDIYVSPYNGGRELLIDKAYVQDNLAVSVDDVVTHAELRRYPYLHRLLDEIPNSIPDLHVGLLLGLNCSAAMEPLEYIYAQGSGPSAWCTRLGWVVAGNTDLPKSDNNVKCNLINVSEPCVSVCRSVADMFQSMHDVDFSESVYVNNDDKKQDGNSSTLCRPYSCNDVSFMNIMQSQVKFVDGHYTLPLPFKDDTVKLPFNRASALQRLHSLKHKFNKHPEFKVGYTKFMQEMLQCGYAKRCRMYEAEAWYIPHFSVMNPHKPLKFRVVFDASAQYEGLSLNKVLLSGPDLTNSLIGVLLRFRQESVAVMADIKQMFYQVRVPEYHQRYMKFVWWPEGDVNKTPEDYQLTVHMFGAISSPSAANFALHCTAIDNEQKYGNDAKQVLLRNFYVDDMLKSFPDTETASRVIAAVYNMCKAGGFELTKFVSSDAQALTFIPLEHREEPADCVNLVTDSSMIKTVLGLGWTPSTDNLSFRLTLPDKPFTRRGLLSIVSSIYDPLGLIGPYLLKGRLMLQRLCHAKLDWDTTIEDDDRTEWDCWTKSLLSLVNVRIQRCVRSTDQEEIESVSMHHFSDASQTGYGTCSYLRIIDLRGRVHCTLLFAKSRVAPRKAVTVPRLELAAATVAVKCSKLLSEEMDYPNAKHYFWTDSMAVLGYISNEAKRYHVFVANRVQFIRDHSIIDNWRHVDTELNPADIASRGLDWNSEERQQLWFQGPSYLWEPDATFSSGEKHFTISDEDPEVKKSDTVKCMATVTLDEACFDKFIRYHSNWYMLKKRVAWLRLVFLQLLNCIRKVPLRDLKQPLTVDDLKMAELSIFRYVQGSAFKSEQQALQGKGSISSTSRLHRLAPELFQDGLIRVGGRLRRSTVEFESKHPIILPSTAHATELLAQHYHEQSYHSGKEHVLAALRKRFWIFGARRLLIRIRQNCFTCRKLFDQPMIQKMSDLPKDRVEPDLPPFTNVGVDFFGPMLVKVGRSLVKRYGCLFTCLTMRAIHLEVAFSLDTDSFINALQRFMCRRGTPKLLRSDNGTNMVGAHRELRDSVKLFNSAKVASFCQQKDIEWVFNPPYSSHMGGVWERCIRSVRKILSTLLTDQHLSDENLLTFLCIAEFTVNSRPLSSVSDDPADLEPLTANHLLQLKQDQALPPGIFVKQDSMSRRRWRQIQFLADTFWRRWTAEYLPPLQLRSKWHTAGYDLQENDLVLLVEPDAPRYQWTLGRVVRPIVSKDNLVRSIEVKTKTGIFIRPIHKLCLIEKCKA